MATLVEATAAADVASVRELFSEYARAVDEPCCFAGFERELAALATSVSCSIRCRRCARRLRFTGSSISAKEGLTSPSPGALCFELSL